VPSAIIQGSNEWVPKLAQGEFSFLFMLSGWTSIFIASLTSVPCIWFLGQNTGVIKVDVVT